jgi:hypothetical protein
VLSFLDIKKGLRFRAKGVGQYVYEVIQVDSRYAWLLCTGKAKGNIQVKRENVPKYIESIL